MLGALLVDAGFSICCCWWCSREMEGETGETTAIDARLRLEALRRSVGWLCKWEEEEKEEGRRGVGTSRTGVTEGKAAALVEGSEEEAAGGG